MWIKRIKTVLTTLLILLFIVDSACYGLGTIPASRNPAAKAEISAALLRTQVRYAESDPALRLLENNNTDCLLLCNGSYLVTKDLADDDIRLLRAINHEDTEALLQLVSRDNPQSYNIIKEAFLDKFSSIGISDVPDINHLIAKAFEILLLINDGIIPEKELSRDEHDFAAEIESVIMPINYIFVKEGFWDHTARGNRLKAARNRGVIFYQAASSGNRALSLQEKKEKFLKITPPPPNTIESDLPFTPVFKIKDPLKDYLDLAATVALSLNEAQIKSLEEYLAQVEKLAVDDIYNAGSGHWGYTYYEETRKRIKKVRKILKSPKSYEVEDFLKEDPPLPVQFEDVPFPDSHVEFLMECQRQEEKVERYLNLAYRIIPSLDGHQADILKKHINVIGKCTLGVIYNAGGGHYGNYDYDDLKRLIKKVRDKLVAAFPDKIPGEEVFFSGQAVKNDILSDQYRDLVEEFMEENADFENIESENIFRGLYSIHRQTREGSFSALIKNDDERLVPLIVFGFIVDIKKMCSGAAEGSEVGWIWRFRKNDESRHLSIAAKCNIFLALLKAIDKDNPAAERDIKKCLTGEEAKIDEALTILKALENVPLFQPLIANMDSNKSTKTAVGTIGVMISNFFREIFEAGSSSHLYSEVLQRQNPRFWQPSEGHMATLDETISTSYNKVYICSDNDAKGYIKSYSRMKDEARRYLIGLYHALPHLTAKQKNKFLTRLEKLGETSNDFSLRSYETTGLYHNIPGTLNGEYADMRHFISQIKNRLLPEDKKGVYSSGYCNGMRLIDLDNLQITDPVGGKAKSFLYFKRLKLQFPKGVVITKEGARAIAEGDMKFLDMISGIIWDKMKVGSNKVSVRSSPEVSMPGQLETVIDVGGREDDSHREEFKAAILKVARSWNSPEAARFRMLNGISDDVGQGIIVQKMVYGNSGLRSGTGIAFSRNSDTGEKGLFGNFAVERSGNSLVTEGKGGSSLELFKSDFCPQFETLGKALGSLEDICGFPQEVEFTIEHGELYFLQTRDMRFPPEIEAEILKAKLGKDIRAILRLEKLQTKMNKRRIYKFDAHGESPEPLFQSRTFLPGAMSGTLAFSAKKALELSKDGKGIILVEVPGMEQVLEAVYSIKSIGLITTRYQNAVCHGAILARGEGVPCVIDPPGVEVKENVLIYGKKQVLKEGDRVVIADGKVYAPDIFGDKKEGHYLKEVDGGGFRPFGIDIDEYRQVVRKNHSGHSYEVLLNMNVMKFSKLLAASKAGNEDEIHRLNLEKHFLHELLLEKGKETGKTENEINGELAIAIKSARLPSEIPIAVEDSSLRSVFLYYETEDDKKGRSELDAWDCMDLMSEETADAIMRGIKKLCGISRLSYDEVIGGSHNRGYYPIHKSVEIVFPREYEDKVKKLISDLAPGNEGKRAHFVDIKFRNVKSEHYSTVRDIYDTGSAAVLWLDLIYSGLHTDRVYTIKYDESRLTPSQIGIIEEYVGLLKVRSGNPKNVKLVPFSGVKRPGEAVISVYCTGKGFKGEGHIGIPERGPDNKPLMLRITAMMNIALAASNIPDGLTKEDLDKYMPLISYIKNEYLAIMDRKLLMKDDLDDILRVIRRITLDMPGAVYRDIKYIEEHDRLARTALIAA